MEKDPFEASLPPFQPDGYLPEGLFACSEAEVLFRFGTSNRRRRRLALRLRRWIMLGRQVKASRLLMDGSFVRDLYTWIPRNGEKIPKIYQESFQPSPSRSL